MNPDNLEPVLFAGVDGDGRNTGLIRINRKIVEKVEADQPIDWSRMFYLYQGQPDGVEAA